MRIPALAVLSTFTILAVGTISAVTPVRAQAYDPAFPVCMQVYGLLSRIECDFTSLAQCAISASGRGAQCIVNPYFANAYQEAPVRHHRRRHAY